MLLTMVFVSSIANNEGTSTFQVLARPLGYFIFSLIGLKTLPEATVTQSPQKNPKGPLKGLILKVP